MGLFDWLRKKPVSPDAAGPQGLWQLCYGMAYFFVPQMLYADASRVLGYFTHQNMPAGPFLYAMACTAQQIEPSTEDALKFQAHTGELPGGVKYYVLEYPTPPPVDPDLRKAVLAPYFSAILQAGAGGDVDYYVLGQRPFGGTTLRSVSRDGVNANLGEGPAPDLSAFLDVLAQRTKSG
jgi:hypothetical protein